ncbi:MAG: type II toxin-antitoxin system RelE/ParE family toxin [Candidatus Berkiellales bacterium]
MIFIETSMFTKLSSNYLSDAQYRELQQFLVENPNAGDIIKETGGLRKLRWATGTKGKRGGIRIVYYFYSSKDQIYLMTLYAKNEVSDLSSEDKKTLKKILEKMLKGH